MSWWQYKGDDNNLFGPEMEGSASSKSKILSSQTGTVTKSKKRDKKSVENCVDMKNANEKTQKGQMQTLNQKLDQWISVLQDPKTINALMNTLEEIKTYFNSFASVAINDLKKVKILQSKIQAHIGGGKTVKNKLMVFQVFYQITYGLSSINSRHNGETVIFDVEGTEHSKLADTYIMMALPGALYAMMFSNTDYYRRYHPDNIREMCLVGIEKSGKKMTTGDQYLPYDLDVVLKVITLNGYDSLMSKRLYSIISLNMESKIKRVRELLLLIFRHVITDEPYLKNVILLEILTDYSWLNRSKHDLLAVVFKKYDYLELMKQKDYDPFLKPESFFGGLLLSLKHQSILTSSKSLIKVLAKKTPALLNTFLVDVLKMGSEAEIDNLILYFSEHLNLAAIYEKIKFNIPDSKKLLESPEFEFLQKNQFQNLVIYRKLFHQSFAPNENLEVIDRCIKENCMQHTNLATRKIVLEIWLENISLNIGNFDESIKNVTKFLKVNLNTEDDSFVKFLSEKIPRFLLYLLQEIPATITSEKQLNVKQKAMLNAALEITTTMLDAKYDKHPEIIVCTNIYLAFMNYFAEGKHQKTLTHNKIFISNQKNLKIVRVLQKVGTDCLVLKNNEVRTLALEVKKIVIRGYMKLDTYKATAVEKDYDLFEQSSHRNIDYCEFSEQYAELLLMQLPKKGSDGLLVQLMIELMKSFEIVRSILNAFDKDPFNCVKNINHIFIRLNYMKAQYKKLLTIDEATEKDMNMFDLMDLVVNKMLLTLNFNDGRHHWPTQAKMQESLEHVIKQSKIKSTDLVEDRMLLLNSIWFTLKACSDFSTMLAIKCLEDQEKFKYSNEPVKSALLSLLKIIHRCCHKDAVVAVGDSLGSIIKCLTPKWTEKLYSHLPKTYYDEIVDYVKVHLIDCYTNVNIIKGLPIDECLGVCTIFRQVAENDESLEKELFHYCIVKVLPLTFCDELLPVYSMSPEETKEFIKKMNPVHIAQLIALISSSKLEEQLWPFMDKAVIVAFEKIQSKNPEMQKLALSLLKSVTKYLANTQKYYSKYDCEDIPSTIAYDDLFTKFPDILEYITKQIGASQEQDVLLLEFLCHFEYRNICLITDRLIHGSIPYISEPIRRKNKPYKDMLKRFVEKKPEDSDEKFHIMLGRFAAHIEELKDLPNVAVQHLSDFLTFNELNYLYAFKFCAARYKNSSLITDEMALCEKVKHTLQINVATNNALKELAFGVRSLLLDLLIDIGLDQSDKIIKNLMFNVVSPDMTENDYTVWSNKVTAVLNKKKLSE